MFTPVQPGYSDEDPIVSPGGWTPHPARTRRRRKLYCLVRRRPSRRLVALPDGGFAFPAQPGGG